MTIRIIHADVMDGLRQLPDDSVHCVVTSPPYWNLRDYGFEGQIGLEPSIEAHVAKMVEVFAEVRRVLRPDGTLWLNYGDMYANDGKWGGSTSGKHAAGNHGATGIGRNKRNTGLKPKDLVMMPHRIALALQADGWWVRDDIVWHKPNPMPSSVTDRCTPAKEYVFLLTKRARYFFDALAIAEAAVYGEPNAPDKIKSPTGQGFTRRASANNSAAVPPGTPPHTGLTKAADTGALTRNRRNVWTIATEPYPQGHFATMPTELARLCIMAGTSERGCCAGCGAAWVRVVDKSFVPQFNVAADKGIKGAFDQKPMDATSGFDGFPRGTTKRETSGWAKSCPCKHADCVPATVLDPFGGAGTTGLVADRLQRNAILIEASADYVGNHIRPRIANADGPLLGALAMGEPAE